jgi:hypothetical protein
MAGIELVVLKLFYPLAIPPSLPKLGRGKRRILGLQESFQARHVAFAEVEDCAESIKRERGHTSNGIHWFALAIDFFTECGIYGERGDLSYLIRQVQYHFHLDRGA